MAYFKGSTYSRGSYIANSGHIHAGKRLRRRIKSTKHPLSLDQKHELRAERLALTILRDQYRKVERKAIWQLRVALTTKAFESVASHFNISVKTLLMRRGRQFMNHRKQLAIYAVRTVTSIPWLMLAEIVGLHHSTVMYAHSKIATRVSRSTSFSRMAVAPLLLAIEEGIKST